MLYFRPLARNEAAILFGGDRGDFVIEKIYLPNVVEMMIAVYIVDEKSVQILNPSDDRDDDSVVSFENVESLDMANGLVNGFIAGWKM